jgi:acyl-coenzyme A synthetase/AMP-(fatty) acid ligase
LDKGSAVAIDMPMNVNSVVIYLAIVLAGYVVVSIADSFAPIEISTRLKISEAKAIFTQVITLFSFPFVGDIKHFILNFSFC